jgi:hypothetical protein
MTCDELDPLSVAASSPTSSHQTFSSVHVPVQWMPSPAPVPMIALRSTAPSASWKIGGWPSSWPPELMP